MRRMVLLISVATLLLLFPPNDSLASSKCASAFKKSWAEKWDDFRRITKAERLRANAFDYQMGAMIRALSHLPGLVLTRAESGKMGDLKRVQKYIEKRIPKMIDHALEAKSMIDDPNPRVRWRARLAYRVVGKALLELLSEKFSSHRPFPKDERILDFLVVLSDLENSRSRRTWQELVRRGLEELRDLEMEPPGWFYEQRDRFETRRITFINEDHHEVGPRIRFDEFRAELEQELN